MLGSMQVWSTDLQVGIEEARPDGSPQTEEHRSLRQDSTDFAWMAEDAHFTQGNSSSAEAKGFQFVAESGKSRPGGPVRNLIRSQARRKVNSRIVPVLAEGDKTEVKKRAPPPKSRKSRQLVQLDPVPSPSRGPGRNAFDPFALTSSGLSNKAYELLTYYDSVFRHTYLPVEPREQWVAFAVSDTALMSATLFTAALSLSLLKGKLYSLDAVYYQAQIIRAIKARMAHTPDEMITNASICTVACLSLFEAVSANQAGIMVHMNGLESLVKRRGGLQSLADSRLTINLTSWIDAVSAIVLESKTRFERDDTDTDAIMPKIPYSRIALRYQAKLRNLSGLQTTSDETVEIYHRIHYISAKKDAISCRLEADVSMESYTDITDALTRRVIRLFASEELQSKNSNPTNIAIFKLFGNAVIIHIYLFLRDLPRGLPFLHLLSNRVRGLLETQDIQRLNVQYPEMMLWIFMMGGLGGIGTPNRGWFAALLAETCVSLGILGGKEIAFTLSEFLWSELYLSPVTMGFWNEVALAQGAETTYSVRRLTDDVSVAGFNAPPDLT